MWSCCTTPRGGKHGRRRETCVITSARAEEERGRESLSLLTAFSQLSHRERTCPSSPPTKKLNCLRSTQPEFDRAAVVPSASQSVPVWGLLSVIHSNPSTMDPTHVPKLPGYSVSLPVRRFASNRACVLMCHQLLLLLCPAAAANPVCGLLKHVQQLAARAPAAQRTQSQPR
jgi:hypothetical protein